MDSTYLSRCNSAMKIRSDTTGLSEVLVLTPTVHSDERGFFFESFNSHDFALATGESVQFVQDNHSRSGRGVLRGLHYQVVKPQGKLVRVVHGTIFDVAVDIRRNSPSFGAWTSVELSAENHRQMWVPPGFAHGFIVLSEYAEVFYKTTDFYAPEHERSIKWDDPRIGISWPLSGMVPILSQKDQDAGLLDDLDAWE